MLWPVRPGIGLIGDGMKLGMGMAAIALLAVAASAPAKEDEASFSAAQMRAHVAFLADDTLEGRDAGSRGYEIAARYVATQFEALGLKPANDGKWLQTVPFKESRLSTESAPRLTIGDTVFEQNKSVIIGPSLKDAEQKIDAPVVFVGFGLESKEAGINDYAGLDVKGKYVAVLQGFPKGMRSDMAAHLNAEKSKVASRRGAIGVISLRTELSEKSQPWARLTAFGGRPSVGWANADGTPHTEAPNIRSGALLNEDAATALFAGAPKPWAAIKAEAAKPGAKIKGFALKPRVTVERKSTLGGFTSPNVVAVLPGTDPALAGEYVLLMAHLDHNGIDPKREGDKIFNGAMDNASGVATLIEVARAMSAPGMRPKRPILFAAVTAEEDGLLGADYLSRNPIVGTGKVVGVVNLDMPILLYDFKDVVAFGSEHSDMGQAVARAGQKMGVALSADPLPEERLFTRSDHYAFVRQGVPSVFLMTGFANGGEKAFQDFLKTHYHRPSDQIDLPFDWNAAAKFAQINYLIAREIADAPAAPRWYKGSFFGDLFAPNAAKAAAPTK